MNPTEPPGSGSQPTYIDPITGSPLYIDPKTGQLSYGSAPTGTETATTPNQYAGTTPPTIPAPAYPSTTGYATAGYSAGHPSSAYAYPSAAGSPGYSYPLSSYGYGQTQPKTNGLAIGALVTGIAGLLLVACYGIGGILAGTVGAILGHVARRQTRARGEAGSGLALAGIICGWIAVALGIAVVIFFIYLFTHLDSFTPDTPNPIPS